MVDLDVGVEAADVDVVGAVEQDDMDEGHSSQQGDDAVGHDFVFMKEALIAKVAAGNTQAYDEDGENSTPPAVEKGGVVGSAGAALGRGLVVQGAWDNHAGPLERTRS